MVIEENDHATPLRNGDDKGRAFGTSCPVGQGNRARRGKDNRLFINAVIWILKSVPHGETYRSGLVRWYVSYKRFNRWSIKNRWETIFQHLQRSRLRLVMLDSTIVRAHHMRPGKKGGP